MRGLHQQLRLQRGPQTHRAPRVPELGLLGHGWLLLCVRGPLRLSAAAFLLQPRFLLPFGFSAPPDSSVSEVGPNSKFPASCVGLPRELCS